MNATTHPTTITAPAGLPYLEVVREFDAPVSRVFRAHVEPDLVVRWLGPYDTTMVLEEWDVRTGGAYRYRHQREGLDVGFGGVYHSVGPDEHIVQTFEFDGAPGEVALDFTRFEVLPGDRTRVTGRSVFPSVETRDAAVASGMEHGVRASMERLDTVLAD